MGKAIDLKKIGNIKGLFHERIGMIKDKNGKDLRKLYFKTWMIKKPKWK